MRHVLTYAFIGIVAAVFLLASSTDRGEAETRPWMVERPEPPLVFDEHCCSCDEAAALDLEAPVETVEQPEYMVSEERMVEEVVQLWEMWFDDQNAKASDPRREDFYRFAEYVVEAVRMYQDGPTDIGGQLPGAKNDHLVVGYMIAKESSVTPDAVNDSENGRGEVCLMQLHGKALAGYAPEKVLHNPKLCVLLGTRWMTHFLPKCQQDGAGGIFGSEFAWEDADWIGPLSLYAGGPRAQRKDGSCAQYGTIRERIDAVRFYRSRIDKALEYWEE